MGRRGHRRRRYSGRLPVTLELGAFAVVIGLLIAVPVGIYSAMRQDTVGDYAGRTIAVIRLATPNFWLGVMVMLYPVIWWGWSPPVELIRFRDDPLGNLGMFLVPSLILGTALAASTMPMTRTMMLEVLRQDYIRTAWAKGLSERLVVVRHATKNALIPVVTLIGLQLPILVGGSVIMENIFVLPGLGQVLLKALHDRDYPSRIIQGARVSMLVGLAATTINVVVAILVGGTTGFLGGKVDLVTQRFVDAWIAFPGLLLLLTLMSVAGRGCCR